MLHASLQREQESVSEALGLLALQDEQRPADILLQLPSILPAPAKQTKNEPLDRRRKLSLHEPETPRKTALALSDLPPGKASHLQAPE